MTFKSDRDDPTITPTVEMFIKGKNILSIFLPSHCIFYALPNLCARIHFLRAFFSVIRTGWMWSKPSNHLAIASYWHFLPICTINCYSQRNQISTFKTADNTTVLKCSQTQKRSCFKGQPTFCPAVNRKKVKRIWNWDVSKDTKCLHLRRQSQFRRLDFPFYSISVVRPVITLWGLTIHMLG